MENRKSRVEVSLQTKCSAWTEVNNKDQSYGPYDVFALYAHAVMRRETERITNFGAIKTLF